MTTEFVNVKILADHFKVSERLIRTWVNQGKIPKDTYVHIQQTYRFNLPAVEAALLYGQTTPGHVETTPVLDHDAGDTPNLDEGGDRVLTADNIGTWGDIAESDDDI
tara:strand:- start:166 stop:486 length:321 start_codon:yes stop_codon:yes gene_type:complete